MYWERLSQTSLRSKGFFFFHDVIVKGALSFSTPTEENVFLGCHLIAGTMRQSCSDIAALSVHNTIHTIATQSRHIRAPTHRSDSIVTIISRLEPRLPLLQHNQALGPHRSFTLTTGLSFGCIKQVSLWTQPDAQLETVVSSKSKSVNICVSKDGFCYRQIDVSFFF